MTCPPNVNGPRTQPPTPYFPSEIRVLERFLDHGHSRLGYPVRIDVDSIEFSHLVGTVG